MVNIFTFEGRINRLNYFLYVIVASVISSISDIVVNNMDNIGIFVLLVITNLILAAKIICVTIQRFHDIGKSGYHFWLLLIPIYNIYLELVLLLKKGDDGENIYGEDPLVNEK